MAEKIDSMSNNVGKGEQLNMWPDGNWMNGSDLNEGLEIKQGGVTSSQKVWDLLADGLGQDVKATSLQDLYAWDFCLFQRLLANEAFPPSSCTCGRAVLSMSNDVLLSHLIFPFSFFNILPLPTLSFFLPKGLLLSRPWWDWSHPVARHLSRAGVCGPLWVIHSCFWSHGFKESPSLSSVIFPSSLHLPPKKNTTLHKSDWLNIIKYSLASWAT